MSLQKIEDGKLKEYETSLRECSKNDSGEPVTLKENVAYKFDDMSALEATLYRRKKKLRSADALYIRNEKEIYFFEFKNARKSHVPWKNVHEKAHDSIMTLQVLLLPELSLNDCAKRTTYFLIYNNKAVKETENLSDSFEKLKKTMRDMAMKTENHPILGNMQIYKDTFYKDVYTLDVDAFEEEFLENIYGKNEE